MKIKEFSKQAVSAENIFIFMVENKTEHMLNIGNFLSQILPQKQQQQMDGYKSAFTADEYCVELFFARMSRRKNTASREFFV